MNKFEIISWFNWSKYFLEYLLVLNWHFIWSFSILILFIKTWGIEESFLNNFFNCYKYSD